MKLTGKRISFDHDGVLIEGKVVKQWKEGSGREVIEVHTSDNLIEGYDSYIFNPFPISNWIKVLD